MKYIGLDVEKKEVITEVPVGVTLNLTFLELQVIVAAIGCSSKVNIQESLKYNFEKKAPNIDEFDVYVLYEQLQRLAREVVK